MACVHVICAQAFTCIFLIYYIQTGYGVHKPEQPSWVLPFLQVGTPGTKVSSYIKALSEDSPQHTFEEYKVTDLKSTVSAAGIRAGVVNEVQIQAPEELNLHATGHAANSRDQTTFRSHYASCNKAALNTVASHMLKWPPAAWGRTRQGPFPPRLQWLQDLAVDWKALQKAIDTLFNIDSASNPDLKQGGRLRPFIETCFATLVMYYPERVVKRADAFTVVKSMRPVCMKLQAAITSHNLSGNICDAEARLRQWAMHLRTKFDSSNLDITSRKDIGCDVTVLAKSVQDLGQSLGSTVSSLNSAVSDMSSGMKMLCEEMKTLKESHAQVKKENELLRAVLTSKLGVDLSSLEEPPPPPPSTHSPRKSSSVSSPSKSAQRQASSKREHESPCPTVEKNKKPKPAPLLQGSCVCVCVCVCAFLCWCVCVRVRVRMRALLSALLPPLKL